MGNIRVLWLRWVAANALGEMFGLGLTFAVGAIVIASLGDQHGMTTVLVSTAVAVASGAIEATLVGLAQWWAMRPWFPEIMGKDWWLATLAGALVAYVLGWMPTTIMDLAEQASPASPPAAEPAQWIILLLAGILGIAGGAVLSFAQWLVLRKKVARARLWLPANMLAWLAGMPVIFWGIDTAQKIAGRLWQVLFIAWVLFMAGLIVGAIHGYFLVHLANRKNQPRVDGVV